MLPGHAPSREPLLAVKRQARQAISTLTETILVSASAPEEGGRLAPVIQRP
jgi:hypothetical protein